MKKIVHLDENARIVIEHGNYNLQFRRKSKVQISWNRGRYFSDLTSLCLEYLNSAPVRSEHAIETAEQLIETLKEAEKRIVNLISNKKQ